MSINDIKIASNFSLNNTYFTFQKKLYQPIFSISMSSYVSIANLVMEYMNIEVVNSFFCL